MGRKKVPTHLKIVRGSLRKSREVDNQPEPEKGKPEIRVWLTDRAQKHWKVLSEVLENMGVLTVADGDALALMCDAYAEYLEAREQVDKEGMTYETTNQSGDIMIRAHPAVAIASDAWRRVRAMQTEFGLTPSSRGKISTGKKKDGDPFDELLDRGKKKTKAKK